MAAPAPDLGASPARPAGVPRRRVDPARARLAIAYAQCMRAFALVSCAAVGLAIAAWTPAPASAAGGDAAATQAYLNASYALGRTAKAREGASQAALNGLLARVRSECPNVAAASPQDTDSEQLSNELVGAMIIAGTAPNRQAVAQYARAVSGLHWSNGALTRSVKTFASQLRALSTMAQPNVCGDVRAWVTSGYRTLPTTTVQFNERYKAVNVPLGQLPGGLARFETSAQQGIVHKIVQLEQDEADFEARAVNTYGEMMNAMVLQP